MIPRLLFTSLLLAAVNAPPAQTFQDPHGRYTVSLPAGWAAAVTGDSPVFRNGPSWAQVRLVKAASASEAIDQAVALFRPQFSAFSMINRGDTVIAGRPSHGLNIDATTTAGERVSVLFTAQPQGQHHYFVLVSSTPLSQAPQLNMSVMTLAGSVHFPGE